MANQKLKVVIIDNNRERRELIKSFLPDYAEGFVSDSGNSAFSVCRPDATGHIPDIVILNADEADNKGLFVFDWLNNEPALSGSYIPVILLTQDEFSDRMLDFLEVSDAFIYEGEPEEDKFFSVFIEALDSVEPIAPPEPSYSENKSPERILGLSIDAPVSAEGKPVRSAVLNLDERLSNLEAALERGKRRSEEIRILLAEAQGIKEEKARAALAKRKSSSMLSKARQKVKENSSSGRSSSIIKSNNVLGNRIYQEHRNIGVSQTQKSIYAQTDSSMTAQPNAETNRLDRIVVASNDVAVHKLIKLYLKDKYEVISLDSGMKAIDYFVRNKAEIIVMDAVMPNLSGVKALSSIRWQPNGKEVPAIYLVGDDYWGNPNELSGDYVYAVVRKPFTKGAVTQALDKINEATNRK